MDPYRPPYRLVCCALALLSWAPLARATTSPDPAQTPGARPSQGTVLEPPEAPQASPQEPGDPDQPTSPLPQIPAAPDEAPPGSPIPTTSQPAIESN